MVEDDQYFAGTGTQAATDLLPAPLLILDEDLEALWRFANDDPVERSHLVAALQADADKRKVMLVRVVHRLET